MNELGEVTFLRDQNVSTSQFVLYWSNKNEVYLSPVIMCNLMTKIEFKRQDVTSDEQNGNL